MPKKQPKTLPAVQQRALVLMEDGGPDAAAIHLLRQFASLEPDEPVGRFLAVHQRLNLLRDAWKQFEKESKRVLAEWLDQHGNRCDIPGTESFITNQPETKCKRTNSTAAMMQIMFDVCGGSVEDVAKCISNSADAWKQSECKKHLDAEDFQRIFIFEKPTKIVTKSNRPLDKAARSVRTVNTKFLPAKGTTNHGKDDRTRDADDHDEGAEQPAGGVPFAASEHDDGAD